MHSDVPYDLRCEYGDVGIANCCNFLAKNVKSTVVLISNDKGLPSESGLEKANFGTKMYEQREKFAY